MRVLLLGATGTIGRTTAKALTEAGHETICMIRPGSLVAGEVEIRHGDLETRHGDVTDPRSLASDGFRGELFDAVVSCLASRKGTPADSWAIDHDANMAALDAAKAAGVRHFVLLSAICVQKPLLAFQHAKLAFEEKLMASGLAYSIVRPTAFFKSLSGQIARVKEGKPFLIFGDGQLTACKPISDRDLGCYLTRCLTNEDLKNRILPIGGPGPAITPLEQGEMLFRLLDRPPKYRRVPVGMMDAIIGGLSLAGLVSARLREKADFARIGRYYATESMLVWDETRARYDADATPEFGADRLEDHYARVLAGEATVDLGDHAVF